MQKAQDYERLLRAYITTGALPDASLIRHNPLVEYLTTVMQAPDTASSVRKDKVCERVFLDTMTHFVARYIEKEHYFHNRIQATLQQIAEAHDWSIERRAEGWPTLLQKAGTGCDAADLDLKYFKRRWEMAEGWRDDSEWGFFLHQWRLGLEAGVVRQLRRFIDEFKELQSRLSQNNLRAVPQYLAEHHINESDFMQTWALMGGRWNTIEYERLSHIAKLQLRYPILISIANRMGRVADPQGNRQTGTTSGASEQLAAAAPTDIAGIGMGRELSALLPGEWAHLLDPRLEDVFLKRYVTSRLQVFDSLSHSASSARSLQVRPARPVGPMIVCCDTSGSMSGDPSRVALSLMMRLSELAYRQQRECLLISFAANAHPIDVLRDRATLLRFFSHEATGSTNARPMIELLARETERHPRYAGADILWVTDFRIPIPPSDTLALIEQLRTVDTRFYGLQIGIANHSWTAYFDEIFHITDIKMRIT